MKLNSMWATNLKIRKKVNLQVYFSFYEMKAGEMRKGKLWATDAKLICYTRSKISEEALNISGNEKRKDKYVRVAFAPKFRVFYILNK